MFSNQSSSSSSSSSSSINDTRCNKSPSLFCFLCSLCIGSRKKVTYPMSETNRQLYQRCYKRSVTQNGADKCYSSDIFCASCVTNMREHINKNKPLKYSSPAIWNQPNLLFKQHEESCYVCLAEEKKNKKFQIFYEWPSNCQHNVTSAILNAFNSEPLINYDSLNSQSLFETSFDCPSLSSAPKVARYETSESEDDIDDDGDGNRFTVGSQNLKTPQPYDQPALNDLVRELDLSKEQAAVLASSLKKRNLFTGKISHYQTRNHEILNYFDECDGMPFLSDVHGLFRWLNVEYVPEQWRLFIDSSKSSLKCVLLHNGNQYPSIPLLYSPTLKETYSDVKLALDLIGYYTKHKWKVIADLKLLNVMCGIGSASSTNPCLLCNWRGTYRGNKRHQQYHQNCQPRTEFNIGFDSVINKPLVDLEDVLLPPLHIKIGLVAQFIKALSPDGFGFKFIANILNYKSKAKLEAGQLDGTEIRKLFKHSNELKQYLSKKEVRAWNAFESTCNNFLGKRRADNYREIIKQLIDSYEDMGCNMSYKVHLLSEHLDDFPDSCADYSDEMGERFHQDIKVIEKRYQGRFNKFMLSDYCWYLKRETNLESRKNSRRTSFPTTA